jgi:hypothetical protein
MAEKILQNIPVVNDNVDTQLEFTIEEEERDAF